MQLLHLSVVRPGRLPFHPDEFPESLLDGFEASGTSATANSALLLEKVLKYLSAGHTKGVPGPFLLIAE